jgi:hypothetical protein
VMKINDRHSYFDLSLSATLSTLLIANILF